MTRILTLILLALVSLCTLSGCLAVSQDGQVVSDRQAYINLLWKRSFFVKDLAAIQGEKKITRDIENDYEHAVSHEEDKQAYRTLKDLLKETIDQIEDYEKRFHYNEYNYGFSGGVPGPGAHAPTTEWISNRLVREGYKFRDA